MLAEITLALNSAWTATAVTVDEKRRPFLAPTSLLQELAFKESPAAISSVSYRTVAAGNFQLNGTAIGPVYNLAVSQSSPTGEYLLTFSGYQNPNKTAGIAYIVKGTVLQSPDAATPRATFQLVAFEDADIRVRALDTGGAALGAGSSFMVEISQIGGGS